MISKPTNAEQPFWKDERYPYPRPSGKPQQFIEKLLPWIYACYRITWLIALLSIFGLFAVRYPLLWIFVALEAGVIMFVFSRSLSRQRRARNEPKAEDVQRLARERTGADVIGSAIHVAGHPLLQVKQPVVLGLKGEELSIYSYSSPEPIDTINVRDIEKIQTVVFDDEYVPHADVVDNTAQALQLTLTWRGTPCTCSFRRMYKVRPIDWYQAIQRAKALGHS